MTRGEYSIKNINSYLAKEEWNKVIAACNKAIANDPGSLKLYPFLAKAYAHQGKIKEAISAYHQALDTRLNQAEIHAELGLLYSKQQNLELGAFHYQQALALKPDWAELQYNLAVVIHQLGDWDMAIASYTRALAIKPDYAAVYFNLGVLYDQKGELEAARANYQQVIDLQSNFIKAYSNLGSTFARQKEYTKAIKIFQQGIHLDPTWATLHNNLGQVYWFNGQPELAITNFEYAITLEPKMALSHHNLGKLWQQQGNYTAAIDCFRTVIKLEPKNILAYSHCSDALLKIGNLEPTLELWRQAINLQPDFVNSYCQRAFNLTPNDLLDKARIACAHFLEALTQKREVAAIYDHLWRTYFYMGDILFEYGGVKQAEIYYHRALQIKPNQAELYLRLGNCLAKQKRLDAATTVYQIGLTLDSEHPQICFQLGKILERKEETGQAIDYYEAVLNQKIERVNQWENLPSLFPSEENLTSLPRQIYHYTQDWIRDCQLEDFNYVEVAWGDTFIPHRLTGKRQPKAITLNIPGHKSNPDCGGINCGTCMSKLIEYFHPIQLGKNTYQCSFEKPPPIQNFLPFVTTIPEGRCWIAPQKNSWIICNALAVITPDNYLLGDLSRDYPWFLPECPYQERTDHTLYSTDRLPPVIEIEGRVALLSSLAGHVYYHWMFDIIPRIELIRLSGIKLAEIDWFVVNSLSKPYQKETLSILGIPETKIIESDRNSHIQATEMIIPSFPGYLDWVPEGTIKFLRQAFLAKISLANTNFSKRIYISRGRAKNRQIINESEVEKLLKSYGFQTIFLEEMSVLEQVAVFANAEAIIAPHGSGLSNLVFCSPNTQVVEIFSPNYVRTDYWIISQQLHLQHYYLVGRNFDCLPLRGLMYQNALTEDILVKISSLQLILKLLK